MNSGSRIFVAGHRGLVGSTVVQKLKKEGHDNLVLKTRQELNLSKQREVDDFFESQKIEYVFLCAAKVGGIWANQNAPADFLYENLLIASNVIHAAATQGVKKLLFLGSSCIYPKHATQPISEESLLTGPLESTNEGYAIAKIAGLKLCEKYFEQYGKCFISAMPTNLYGPGDNFHPENSHVIPGLMRRFHEAKMKGAPSVTVWGTGSPQREFLHVEDLADALYVLMQKYEHKSTINVGTGKDCTIAELASLMKEVTGFSGTIEFDPSRPDGTPRKVLNTSKINALGWEASIPLRKGLQATYDWALTNGVLS